MEDLNELDFKNNNPGAVKYGNYINYYQFHSVEDRIKSLPTNIWNKRDTCYVLDLGCNAGDLTQSLHNFIKENVSENTYTLGVDIDNRLIERAVEKNQDIDIEFMTVDFMNKDQRSQISGYLRRKCVKRFDIVFCYSVTMWIHLNHGDSGLKEFLSAVSKLGEMIVIEPQPWKCYRHAIKRIRAAGSGFPLFYGLKIRKSVEDEIEHFLVDECQCCKVYESERVCWGRKTVIFKSNFDTIKS